MWKSWICDLICSSEFILEWIVFYNVSYYYTLKFKASFLLKRQICHSSLHMCRCFEALSVNCLTIVFVLTLRYVFAVFLLKIHSKQENLRVGRVIKNPGNLDWIVRLRSLCELRRDTEFSKEKYRKCGIFRKFVVAGVGFRSLGTKCRLCANL